MSIKHLFIGMILLTSFTLTLVPIKGGYAEQQQVQVTKQTMNTETGAADWSDDRLLASPEQIKSMKIPVKAKGLYLSGWSAGNQTFPHTMQLLQKTELNALVIDIKEDEGRVTYQSGIPLVNAVKANSTRFIPDIDQLVQTMRDQHVYPIARIVCFKDPFLAGKKVEWAMQRKTGGVWTDQKGVVWIDPYRKEVWDYNIALAKEAAMKGFKEIQFDYVRFPDNGKRVDQEVAFYQQKGKAKEQVISDFLAYAQKELAPYHVYVSADIFGLVPSVNDDMGIGQKWERISPTVDYISPMMYPSHYGSGMYGVKVPDAAPYAIISQGLIDAKRRDAKLVAAKQRPAMIRPWYQDFTARWVKGHIPYGPREVKAQIQAGKDQGIEQYLIWDAANTYSEAAWTK